ncbi:MAG: DUF3842 family protein [Christensenellales bacterium]|nr:DUF3842 family protein [Christensenellales bacterium]
MKLLIIDGQSGRLGAQLIEGLRKAGLSDAHTLIAVGTNALATSAMINAGADQGATGENAVVVQCRSADVIAGPIGITLADAMLGEVSPLMAVAVGQSAAQRVLVPSDRCATLIAGVPPMTRRQAVDAAVACILRLVSPSGQP